ncbi:MAG: sodium:solute symporter family protein [Desulfurococcaceae archaeon]
MAKEFSWGIDLPIVVVLYLLSIVFIGYYSYKKRLGVSVRDFFTASKTLGYVVLGLGLFATIASGNTYLGYAGQAYRAGGYPFLVVPAFYVSIIIGFLLLGTKIIPLSNKKGYITPGDYLKDRFGSTALTAFLLLLMFWCTFVQFFEQSIAMGYIGEVTSGGYLSYEVSAALFTIAVVLLTLLGGFRGTALANFVMGVVMVAGLLGALFGIVPILGGAEILARAATSSSSIKVVLPEKPETYLGWISTVLLIMFGVIAYFQVWNFIIANKDLKSLREQFKFSIAIYAIIPTIFVILGVLGLALFPGLSKAESEKVQIYLINEAASRSPAGYVLGELILLAVVAATLSTAAAVIFAMAMTLAKDFYAKLVNPRADEKKILNVAKILIVALGAFGYLIVMTPKLTLWEWVVLKFQVGLQAVAPLLLSLYIPWVNSRGAWAGSAIGFAIVVGSYLSGITKLYNFDLGVLGFLVNAALVLLVSYLTKKPDEVAKAAEIIAV